MKGYTCTYVESPEVNPDEANPLGEVDVDASSNREAAKKALKLPLPEGADHLSVHVCPHEMEVDAGFETFEEDKLK